MLDRLCDVMTFGVVEPCGECGGQLFVSDDCTTAFFCMLGEDLPEGAPEDAEGCELVCDEDEVLIADPR